MAETMKTVEKRAASARPAAASGSGDCLRAVLKLLAEFGKELKLSDAVLKLEVNPDALDIPSSPDAHLCSCLQEHISKLQAVSERLSALVASDASTSSAQDSTTEDAVASYAIKEPPLPPGSAGAADDVMVQIRAGKSEIERRISAFMERKQMEINENNVREFCNVIDCNQENSCARTDAVFTPYPGFKSHVKVTRVVNTYGPQTRGGGQGALGEQQKGPTTRDGVNMAVEERLQNIEAHLRVPAVGPVPLGVYQRLKKLEDRILELEGLSPEYFQSTSHLHKRQRTSVSQACSLTDLDQKISAVKAALLKRAHEFGPGYGAEFPL
ncbi:MAP3K12-binding inhibitory protein 1 [Antennarius striatus]|uniref:MAP3K12-binding inhibitory protein 1 n=1 Tax=Antennarius striatus TaxID=241820 RepID=UPI0035B1D040